MFNDLPDGLQVAWGHHIVNATGEKTHWCTFTKGYRGDNTSSIMGTLPQFRPHQMMPAYEQHLHYINTCDHCHEKEFLILTDA